MKNPDASLFVNCLFEIEEEEALPHCSNSVKCICHRLLRSQVYRAIGLAMGARGRGNQVSFGPAIAAFARGAFPDGAGIKAGIDVHPMDPEEHDRYYETGPEREIIPSGELVQRFLAVLVRILG